MGRLPDPLGRKGVCHLYGATATWALPEIAQVPQQLKSVPVLFSLPEPTRRW